MDCGQITLEGTVSPGLMFTGNSTHDTRKCPDREKGIFTYPFVGLILDQGSKIILQEDFGDWIYLAEFVRD